MKEYMVLGLMSGTSLDGLDLAFMRFTKDNSWHYTLLQCETVPYSPLWKRRLQHQQVQHLSAIELQPLDAEYASLLAEEVNAFLRRNGLDKADIDFVSSHGHTLFHQPPLGYTTQIGNGAILSAQCDLDSWSDFRTADVALGGQGAPLVPIGDRLLFPQHEACLNLGGFSNISLKTPLIETAFDVCPVNIVLNQLAEKCGQAFDEGGTLAASGTINESLLEALNALPYYSAQAPKSLGAEWVAKNITPLLEQVHESPENLLATFTEHVAVQLTNSFNSFKVNRVLITGGGAFNDFLLQRVRSMSNAELTLPDPSTIAFKEALIFGFLGVLASRGEINVLHRYTGAKMDHVAGVFHRGSSKFNYLLK
jgi:anhydro-N-acetylmuramic acid kinase